MLIFLTFSEADEKGNFQTLNHTLHRSLVLVVKQKLGEDYHWVFPQSPWIPGETLRQVKLGFFLF